MSNTKYIGGKPCYYNEVVFSIDDFHDEYDQALYADDSVGPYIQEVQQTHYSDNYAPRSEYYEDPEQDVYTVAALRARLLEAERPLYMRLKLMVRDYKMFLGSAKLDQSKIDRLKRLFVDDLTSIIQEATDLVSKSGDSQTVDIVLKLSILNNAEITKAGRQFGITLRKINRIRKKLNFLPKLQQEELNTSLVGLTSLITDSVFGSVNLKVYGD